MGYFDSFNPMDPDAMARMGMLQAAGQAAMPTPVPVPFGAVLAQAAGGAMSGKMQALQNRQAQLGYDSASLEYNLRKALLGPYVDQLQGGGERSGGVGAGNAPIAGNGATAAPANAASPPGISLGDFAGLVTKHENGAGANPAAKNPLSSATGNGQFLDSTWLGLMKAQHPDLTAGKTDAQILALRSDPQVSALAIQDYARQNGATLAQAGLPVTSATLGAAHALGADGAKRVLSVVPTTPMALLFPPAVIKANPSWKNMTTGAFVSSMASAYGNSPIGVSNMPPANQFAGPGARAPQSAAQPGQGAPSPLANIYQNPMAMAALGIPMTDYQKAVSYANTLPPGPARNEALAAAHHAAGFDLSINQREGSEALGYNANSTAPGGYDLIGRAPKLPEGYGPGSQPDTYAPLRPDNSVPQLAPPSAAGQPGQTPPASVAPSPVAAAAAPPATRPFDPTTPSSTHTGNPTDYAVRLPMSLGDFQRSVPNFQGPVPLMDAVQAGQQPIREKTQEALVAHDETRLERYQDEAAAGQPIYNAVSQLYDILKGGLSTGNATQAATHLANYAHQFGFDSLVPKNFNPADADAFHKLATQLVFAQVKAIGGRPLVSEIEGLSKANPNEALTPEANADILTNILADQRWRDSRARVAKEYMGQYGYLGNFDGQFNQRFPEINVTQALLGQARANGWKLPGNQAASGPPAGALKALKPGTVTHFRNGQSWTMGANGQPVQVQ